MGKGRSEGEMGKGRGEGMMGRRRAEEGQTEGKMG